MINPHPLVFIHGLEGTSQGVKASLLRRLFPGILIPDFSGNLEARIAHLTTLLGEQSGWRLVGSSFGGLMAALFACQRPHQVDRLVLLAPALIWPDFANQPPAPVAVPTVIYHGTLDMLIPLSEVHKLAERVFSNLDFHVVEDDHGLYQTVHRIDWIKLLA